MGGRHRELDGRGTRLALLGVAAATATAAVVVAPSPTPTALLAASTRDISLTAATTPYQAFQDTVDAVLPALVNRFGRPPTVTLQTLLAQIPASLLADVLNANAGSINVPSLLNMLSPNLVSGLTSQVGAGTTSQLSSAVSAAVSTALTTALSGLTGGSFLSTLQSGLVTALLAPLQSVLGTLTVDVPVVGTVDLSTLLTPLGLNIGGLANSIANVVAQDLIGKLTTSLTGALTGSGGLTGGALTNGLDGSLTTALGTIVTDNLGNLVNPLLQAAGLQDASGNIGIGSLLDLVGLNLGSLEASHAISVTTAGPAFTLARLLGVDLGWTPGTETAISNSVNSTPYLTLGTDTLKSVLTTNLTAALGTGALTASLTPILTNALTSTLTSALTSSLTTALTSALTTTVDGTVGSSSTLTTALTTAINQQVGGLGLSILGIDVTGLVLTSLTSQVGGIVTGLTGGTSISTLVNNTVSSTVTSVVGGVVTGATSGLSGTVSSALTGVLSSAVLGVVDAIPSVDIGSVRIPIVVGTGLGAFSAGAAYRDVLAKLSSQPGGLDYTGATSIAGSLTLLPEILLNNAGRANGGVLARFSSILRLFGVNAVTPDVAITSSGGTALGDTGLALGGANLVPVKVDATVEYQPMSDFAAWANPVTLLNNLAAGLMPTYMLRGIDEATAAGQLVTQLESMVTDLKNGGQANSNIYLTAEANHLPLLEPVYLAGDALNMVGLTPVGNFTYRLGNALSPVLTSLVNLGYSDAYWDPATGQYQRTFSTSATPVQFGTLPHIDWSKVGPHLMTSLVTGFRTAFTGPVSMPNAISQAISLISHGGNLLSVGAVPTSAAAKAPTALPTAAIAPTTSKSKTPAPAKPKPAADGADAGATDTAGPTKDSAASDETKPADTGKDKGTGERKAGKPKRTKAPKPKADAASGDSSAATATGDGDGTGRHRAPSSTGGKHRAPESGNGKHAA